LLPLRDKILALLIQLPPSLKITEGLDTLRQVVSELDTKFRYAVEVRDRSWFQDLAYNFFADNNICMVWSQLAELRTPPISTTDFLYLRFIGDRLKDKPFWIWNIQEYKRQNIITNGDCCFNHIIGLSQKDGITKPIFDYQKFYSILVVLDTIGIFGLKINGNWSNRIRNSYNG
jgi:uncharacterized protein DUF72